jgi:hypothetical protein
MARPSQAARKPKFRAPRLGLASEADAASRFQRLRRSAQEWIERLRKQWFDKKGAYGRSFEMRHPSRRGSAPIQVRQTVRPAENQEMIGPKLESMILAPVVPNLSIPTQGLWVTKDRQEQVMKRKTDSRTNSSLTALQSSLPLKYFSATERFHSNQAPPPIAVNL